jgi:ferredoxin
LLDPYSSFGRISTHLFKPVIVWLNNSVSHTLTHFNNYSLFPYDSKGIMITGIISAVVILALAGGLSVKRGRLYCNTVCPVGTLLGLLSKYSLFKIVIDKDNCVSCGECEWYCKSECIDSDNQSVDMTRCVDCYNCIIACPLEAITYKIPPPENEKKEIEINYNKREFIKTTFLYFIGLTFIARAQEKIKVYVGNKIPISKKYPVTPPGSKSIGHFNNTCTACHLCINACPSQVLQPSYLEYGITGILQPRMDFQKSFCNYECKLCGDVCPTGAILPLSLENKKLIQIGKAKFIKEDCVVYTQGTECGACSELCPTKAVSMVPYKNLLLPEVKEEYCIGCGACEFACPAKPYKSIFVDGNPSHLIAKKNETKKKEEKINYQEDFPF